MAYLAWLIPFQDTLTHSLSFLRFSPISPKHTENSELAISRIGSWSRNNRRCTHI